MDTRGLYYFMQVHQKKSISKAAQHLHLSQQGLSAILDKLEKEMGVKLLKRSISGTRLTKNGEYLLSCAKEILKIEKECRLHFNRFKNNTEFLPIACAFGTYRTLVSQYVKTFETRKNNTLIEITEHPDVFCERVLEDSIVDIGFTTNSMNSPTFESHLLASYQVYAIVHESCHLARRSTLNIKILEGLPIIIMSRNFQIYRDFISHCTISDFVPDVQFEAAEIALVHRLAEKGEGIGITVKPLYEEYIQPYMRLIPFEEDTFTWRIYLTVRKSLQLNSTGRHFSHYVLSSACAPV